MDSQAETVKTLQEVLDKFPELRVVSMNISVEDNEYGSATEKRFTVYLERTNLPQKHGGGGDL